MSGISSSERFINSVEILPSLFAADGKLRTGLGTPLKTKEALSQLKAFANSLIKGSVALNPARVKKVREILSFIEFQIGERLTSMIPTNRKKRDLFEMLGKVGAILDKLNTLEGEDISPLSTRIDLSKDGGFFYEIPGKGSFFRNHQGAVSLEVENAEQFDEGIKVKTRLAQVKRDLEARQGNIEILDGRGNSVEGASLEVKIAFLVKKISRVRQQRLIGELYKQRTGEQIPPRGSEAFDKGLAELAEFYGVKGVKGARTLVTAILARRISLFLSATTMATIPLHFGPWIKINDSEITPVLTLKERRPMLSIATKRPLVAVGRDANGVLSPLYQATLNIETDPIQGTTREQCSIFPRKE